MTEPADRRSSSSTALASIAPLIGLGAVTVGCWAAIRALGDARQHLPAFFGWFGVAFAVYLAALRWVRNAEHHTVTFRQTAFTMGLVIVVAVVSRVFLIGTTPTLSDDIYRYRWDGLVQQAGVDPYLYPPNHPALDRLRDGQDRLINFPHLRTVYPPLTELSFFAAVTVNPSVILQKWPFLLSEVLLVAGLTMLLVLRCRNVLWIIAYVWHPLPILEIAGSGHNDALGIALLWLGAVAWELRRYSTAAFGWALAFLEKYAAVVLVPWWWLRRVGRSQLGFFLALSILPLVAHSTILTAISGSLSAMSLRFGSNGSVQPLLALAVGCCVFARLICAAAWAAFAWWWARREPDAVRYLLGVMSVGAALSPALHPWYLLWLMPAFCFWRPSPVVALTGTVVLSYAVWLGRLTTGVWELPLWAHVLEYAPVGVLGLWEVWRCRSALSSRLAMKPAQSVAS